ncbi:hypothetical protein GCM10009850_118880 [Nonomuraea monospora]|uniref:Uncharacterized protein n=2 Tax=Nonomuraea monospora TaxID=568818 RepID=A0ABP5PXL3_9ACTN
MLGIGIAFVLLLGGTGCQEPAEETGPVIVPTEAGTPAWPEPEPEPEVTEPEPEFTTEPEPEPEYPEPEYTEPEYTEPGQEQETDPCAFPGDPLCPDTPIKVPPPNLDPW